MKALVIGGSGPTGPHVLSGLLDRGHDVTMLHRGVHEPSGLPDVRHLHADPHFAQTLLDAIGTDTYDVVIAMYGRIKVIGEVFAPRCGQLVAISGVPVYRGCVGPEHSTPYGMKLMAREDSPMADTADAPVKAAMLILDAERAVFEHGARYGITVSSVRYPQIYGPRNVVPWEWAVVKRVLDGRRSMIVPDDGLWVISRCAARNAAEVVLRIVDEPGAARGQSYNCADEDQFTVRQWVELVAGYAGGDLEIVGIPSTVARSSLAELLPPGAAPHLIVNTEKVRQQLGYVEVVAARDALRETVEWLLANPVRAQDYPLYQARFDYDFDDRMIDRYRKAIDWLHEEVPDETPDLGHPMPHPHAPALTTDERGR